jgi:hypothetical protein
MQINRIECELGITVNAGDFQSIKSTVKMTADVDRGEDPMTAYAALSGMVHTALVEGARRSHPDAVKPLIGGESAAAQITTQATAAPASGQEKRKPGRPPSTAKQATTAVQEAPRLADTSGMGIGGLDEEDGLDGLGGLDGFDKVPAPVSRDEVLSTLKNLVKAVDKSGLASLFKEFGVSSFGQLPEDKYGEINEKALKLIGARAK